MSVEYFVRYVFLPYSIKAVTIPNDDCTFDIYINIGISEMARQKALEHELNHIRKNHFYDDHQTVEEQEKEAG